jgi:hypothetical protein
MALKPFGAQKRHQEINEQQECYQGSQVDHGGSFHTRSQAATKAKRRPIVTKPRINIAGSQIAKFIDEPPKIPRESTSGRLQPEVA